MLLVVMSLTSCNAARRNNVERGASWKRCMASAGWITVCIRKQHDLQRLMAPSYCGLGAGVLHVIHSCEFMYTIHCVVASAADLQRFKFHSSSERHMWCV